MFKVLVLYKTKCRQGNVYVKGDGSDENQRTADQVKMTDKVRVKCSDWEGLNQSRERMPWEVKGIISYVETCDIKE